MRTQNGWSVDPKTAPITAGGRTTHVRAGDVATVLGYVARRFHAEVEPLVTLHGYRSSATNDAIGGDNGSNHISGTAMDLNGFKHPYEGGKGYRDQGFTTAQIAAVRRILADVGPVVQWGYDYPRGWRDGMHFQIRPGTTAAQVAAAAARIHEEDDMSEKAERQIDALYQAMFYGSLAGGVTYPGVLPILAETQKRVTETPAKVWRTPVQRTGGPVSALQELADAKTHTRALEAGLAALAAAQGKSAEETVAAVRDEVRQALADGTVRVEITVPTQE